MEPSKSFQLNREDGWKIVKGLGIAMGGAGVTYLLAVMDVIDVGPATPVWVALASAFLNAAQVWIRGKTQ